MRATLGFDHIFSFTGQQYFGYRFRHTHKVWIRFYMMQI